MASLLATDGYKFSMAEAGWPLREETFYFSFRRGGAQLVAFDLAEAVQALVPRAIAASDYAYLAAHEYGMGMAFQAAMGHPMRVHAAPRGSWVLPREPLLTVTGPSALVSWLEPLVLQLHYRIQLATLAVTDPGAFVAGLTVTCDAQRDLALSTLESVGVHADVRVDAEGYTARVHERASALVAAAGDGARLFEVGLRAASCPEQHMLALEACRAAGITRTSHVEGARALAMVPVGTMGHEHVQRYGSDEAAFRAMKERRPQRSSFLLDTFDTLRSGLPAALAILAEDPSAHDSIRYDSGDKEAQLRVAVREARALGVRPVHVLEDGFDLALLERFERVRAEEGVLPGEQFYGFGGWLVAQPEGSGLTRDRVSAVYKLSRTRTRPVMKFSNDAGKVSVPGVPVAWRRVRGAGPAGIVGQEDEPVPDGYVALPSLDTTLAHARASRPADETVELSPATRALVTAAERAAFPGGH